MDLPENLTTLASNSEINRQYHLEMKARLPWLGLSDALVGQTTHLTDHQKLHDAIDRGLRKGNLNGLALHGADHNIAHGYCNTTYQNELHVTKTGSDANPGTWASPKLTIGGAVTAAVAANASGQTARIRVHATVPGTTTAYREQVSLSGGGTSAAMVLEAAEDGVVITGADNWTGGWTTHDAGLRIYYRTWTNNWGVQALPGGWPGGLGTDIYRRREIVAIDGVWVRQVLTLAEIDDYDAAYFVDEAADRLYIRIPTGGNITTIPVEVAVRDRCLLAQSRPNLTVRGFVFRHAACLLEEQGVKFTGCANLTVEDVTSKEHSWAGMGLDLNGTGNSMTLRRVATDDNGVVGYGSYRGQGLTMEDGTASRNGRGKRAEWAAFQTWTGGAGKVFETRGWTMRRYVCDNNWGPGPWPDTDNKDVLFEDLTSINHTGSYGLFVEANQGPVTVRRGKYTGNFRGIASSHSRNLVIEDAQVWNNGVEINMENPNGAISVTEWDNPSQVWDLSTPREVILRRNLIWGSVSGSDRYLVRAPDTFTGAETWRTTLVAENNAYYSSGSGFPSDVPFLSRNSDGSSGFKNFTDWKTYLGGSRDSTSTFSSSAPSPAPTL